MKVLSFIRLALLVIIFVVYVALVLVVSLFMKNKIKASYHFRRPTIHLMMWMLGLSIEKTGSLPDRTVLFIGNHTSYLDPFVLVHFILAMPVAKVEAATWPLIGYALKVSGVLFVARRSAKSLRSVRVAIRESLIRGESVIVYPEGTTGSGEELLPIKRGIFDLSADMGMPVVPVTIAYDHPKTAYYKDDTFLPHFLNCFTCWRIRARIDFGDARMLSDGKSGMEEVKNHLTEKLRAIRFQNDAIMKTAH